MRFAILTLSFSLMATGSACANDSQLPVSGLYAATSSNGAGGVEHMPPIYKSAADFQKMIRGESRCKDKKINVGSYSFDETATCDTPDGDIRGIPVHRYGTFSARSYTETQDLQLGGMTIRYKIEYVLVRAMPGRR